MRYTMKVNETDYVLNENAEEEPFEMRNKLGQLEDIGEELGVDLVKLFNAKKIYFYDAIVVGGKEELVLKETEHFDICLKEKQVCIYEYEYDECGTLLDKEDYGKKVLYGWALEKEELE